MDPAERTRRKSRILQRIQDPTQAVDFLFSRAKIEGLQAQNTALRDGLLAIAQATRFVGELPEECIDRLREIASQCLEKNK